MVYSYLCSFNGMSSFFWDYGYNAFIIFNTCGTRPRYIRLHFFFQRGSMLSLACSFTYAYLHCVSGSSLLVTIGIHDSNCCFFLIHVFFTLHDSSFSIRPCQISLMVSLGHSHILFLSDFFVRCWLTHNRSHDSHLWPS